MRMKLLLGVSLVALLSACAQAPGPTEAPAAPEPAVMGGKDDLRLGEPPVASPDDVKIEIYNPEKEPDAKMTELRREALREGAQTYGSQMGYARRAYDIEKILERRSSDFDQVFSFDRVTSAAPAKAGYIVPPIVSRSMNAFRTDAEGREASVADEYLTIVRAGRIVPVVPTWRDFLLFSSPSPEEPPKSLLPSSQMEKGLFDEWFREGWVAGVELADEELESRLARLRRDFEGMLQYRRLVSLGMMDQMVLQQADFGVTGEGNEMRIGSRTVEIVTDAEFDTNPLRWSVRAVSERDQGIVATGEIPPLDLD